MTFYEISSGLLTTIGYIVLVYRIIFQLQSGKSNPKTLEKLCTKWIIFTIFLKIQFYIWAVLEIIPLAEISLLTLKLLLFLPQNAISHAIYKKIQKKLQKIKLEEYNSQFGIYLSILCKHIVKLMMKGIKKIAAFVNSTQIEQVQSDILDVIKILQYKKAAIHVRSQAMASDVNQELNNSDFNMSVDEVDERQMLGRDASPKKSYQKSAIGNKMSKILADLDEDEDQTLKLHAELMIIKPDKAKGQKAKYQDTHIEYNVKTSKISLIDKNNAKENGTLSQIRWITKNMINIEIVMKQGRSRIIKLKDSSDVAKFVEPVCMNLQKLKQKSN